MGAVHEAIYRDLRHKIIHLEVEPGQRLREQQLASEYGASRTPIRRVLDQLAAEGLVTIRPSAGASVSEVDFPALAQVWAVRIKITELMADVVRLPVVDEIIDQALELRRRVDESASTTELVTLFDAYHVMLLGIMVEGPVRRIFDQTYAHTARMFAVLLPELDLESERVAILKEFEGFIDASKLQSAEAIAANRLLFLQHLFDRINGIPLIKWPS